MKKRSQQTALISSQNKLLSEYREYVSLLKAQIVALTEQVALQNKEIEALKAEVIELKAALSAPKKTSKNSSSRPSSDNKPNKPDENNAPKQPRTGHGKGGRTLHPNPSQTLNLKPTICLDCGKSLEDADQQLHASYDKIELPEVSPIVTRVHLYKCRCQKCGHSGIAAAPVGYEPGTPFTNSISQELIDLKYNHFMSYKRLSRYMADRFSISISQGAIATVFKRHKDHFDARVSEIYDRIRQSRLVCSDETSARVRGKNEWEWVFQNETVCFHVIRPCRGAKVVEEVMAGHRPRFWVSDLYSAQQNHAQEWQICLSHQLRDCEYAIQEGDVFFAWKLKLLFLKAVAIHRRRHRPIVQNNHLKFKEILDKRLQEILESEPDTQSGRKLKKRYLKHSIHLFTFLTDPQAIPPTNNGSERAIRMSTIYRRVTGGFRSDWGKHFFAAVRSVVNTGQRQSLTPRQSIERAMGMQPTFFLA